MTTKDQLLDQLREALKESREDQSHSAKNLGAVSGTQGYYQPAQSSSVTLNGSNYPNTVIGGGYTVGTGLPSNSTPYYTVTGSNGTGVTAGINWGAGTGITANPWSTNTTTQAGRMELNGDNADLVINGVSILDILKERLNVLIPNPALEKEWDQLKELGDQYRKLEADLKEKAEIWRKLKS